MSKTEITVPEYICERCGHKWISRRVEEPTVCPKCKSPYWNRPKKSRRSDTDTDTDNPKKKGRIKKPGSGSKPKRITIKDKVAERDAKESPEGTEGSDQKRNRTK